MIYVRVKRANQCIFLLCEPADTVGAVKSKVAAVVHMNPEKIRLLSSPETPLVDTKTLSESNVLNDAVLHLAFQIEGSNEWEAVVSPTHSKPPTSRK
ncbi:hypothetical protein Pelo_4905 [Pelomyxa schiedti]|nr:hypothetical protein Pelo_4905 [Pelomyxa schiedti]